MTTTADPILHTKLFIPPVQPGLVSRRRLLERLNAGLERGLRLILVCAPAGYGKTTLLAEWVNGFSRNGDVSLDGLSNPQEMASGWLSLDTADNDPIRFWTHLVAAVQRFAPQAGQGMLNAFAAQSPAPIQLLLNGLINDLAGSAESGAVVLVLDDYHYVANTEIHAGLAFLIEHLPPALRLVLATRADPPLPVASLRARRQLVELRAADLRFTTAEAAGFLNDVMGLNLKAEDVDALETRTEGWVVGLQLAAVSMQGRQDLTGFVQAFTGSHYYILEYLTEEVLARQSEELRAFLLRTSLLERLCGPLCDALLGDHSSPTVDHPSAPVLEHLSRSNLFLIPLDDERWWFRYHHLFADLLQNQLRQQVPPDEIAALHRRAGAWCEANGWLDEAVHYGLEAGDFERVAGIVERAAKANMLNGRVATILRWTEALPEALQLTRPRLRLSHAWAQFLSGRADLAIPTLLDLQAKLPDEPGDRSIRGELNGYLATSLSMGTEMDKVIQLAQAALADLPAEERSARARAFTALGVAYGMDGKMDASHQALQEAARLAQAAGNAFLNAHIQETIAGNLVHQGRLHAAAQVYREINELSAGVGIARRPEDRSVAQGVFLAGIGALGLAEIALEWNDLEGATTHLNTGLDLCRQGGILYNLFNGYLTRARLLNAQGDRGGAVEAFQQVEALFLASRSLPFAVLLGVHLARLKLWEVGIETIPDPQEPGRRISPLYLPVETLPTSVREVQWTSQQRLLLYTGQPEKVLEIDARLGATAVPGGRQARLIESALLKALALQALGDRSGALAALERSVGLSGAEGYLRLYLDEGEPARQLLTWLAESYRSESASKTEAQVLRGPVERILGAFPPQPPEPETAAKAPRIASAAAPPAAGLVEPLSARELEVLQWIAAGLTNQEIAGRLVVSLNTVKKHTSNLFSKLGAANRTQAIAIARQLGLLS